VPVAGVLAALHFVGPNSTHNAIEHRAATTVFAHPQFSLATMQVPKAFQPGHHHSSRSKSPRNDLRAVFDLYDLPPIQVRFERGAPSDRAQRAKQMLHAEAGAMQPHFVDGEVVPEGGVSPHSDSR
jgi:hypothetical protein